MFTIFYEVPPYEIATFKEALFMIETFVEVMSKLILVFFGQADNLLKALVLFVVIDYITGICAAIQEKRLSSSIGAIGIAKKASIFLVASVSHVADQYLMDQKDVLRTVTVMFYLWNEGISILENIRKTGVSLPPKLLLFIKHLKKDGDKRLK